MNVERSRMRLTATVLVAALAIAAPASALTVNINAGSEGTLDPDAGSVSIFLTAGSHTATLVDGLNDGDPSTLYTAWSFRSGNADTWITRYRITLEDDTFILGGFGDGTVNFDSADEAFAQTPVTTLVFEVPTDQFVRFHLTDQLNGGSDNRGGISLGVVAVPEPSTGSLLALGLAGIIARRRHDSRWARRSA